MATFSFTELLNHKCWHNIRAPKDAQGNANPYHKIAKCPGIYKVYISADDVKNICILDNVYTKNNIRLDTGNAQNLSEIFYDNVQSDKTNQENKHVIYIGKAENLRRRIKQYMRTVYGGENHKGGIDIWTIDNYEKYLRIDVFPLEDNGTTARDLEREEINKFKQNHNQNRPMANRQD